MTAAIELWRHSEQICAELDEGTLFTRIADALTGCEITTRIIHRGRLHALDADDLAALEASRDGTENAWFRAGYLIADGQEIAEITAAWLPWRIADLAALEALASNVPLGRALHGCGVTREPLGTRRDEDGTVTARGRLVLPDGTPVAIATERIPGRPGGSTKPPARG